MPNPEVAVIGAGTMGAGIAYVAAVGGFSVRMTDRDERQLERAGDQIRRDLEEEVSRQKVAPSEADDALHRIEHVNDVAEAAEGAYLVIEAVVEDLEIKRKVLTGAARVAATDAVLATNTSALSVTAIAAAVPNPSRVIGMHFFNPVPKMSLCELVLPLQVSATTIDQAEAAASTMGKTTIRVKDRPGFATSRLNALLGNEGFRMLEEGVASPEDTDTAARLGLNHPMGPLEMADLVGLDVRLAVLEHLAATLGVRFRPTNLHRALVDAGRLGRKTGRGVYEYNDDGRRLDQQSDLGR